MGLTPDAQWGRLRPWVPHAPRGLSYAGFLVCSLRSLLEMQTGPPASGPSPLSHASAFGAGSPHASAVPAPLRLQELMQEKELNADAYGSREMAWESQAPPKCARSQSQGHGLAQHPPLGSLSKDLAVTRASLTC